MDIVKINLVTSLHSPIKQFLSSSLPICLGCLICCDRCDTKEAVAFVARPLLIPAIHATRSAQLRESEKKK
jgi:hypothetical protein